MFVASFVLPFVIPAGLARPDSTRPRTFLHASIVNLSLEEREVCGEIELTATCKWYHEGRWLDSSASATCLDSQKVGDTVAVRLKPRGLVSLGPLPLVGPYGRGEDLDAVVTLKTEEGDDFTYKGGQWCVGPETILRSAVNGLFIDYIARDEPRTISLKATATVTGTAGEYGSKVSSEPYEAIFPTARLTSAACASLGPEDPLWDVVASHPSASLPMIAKLRNHCPSVNDARILCTPLSREPFAITGAQFAHRMNECVQITGAPGLAPEAIWTPIVDAVLAQVKPAPTADLIALLKALEVDQARASAERLARALATPWTGPNSHALVSKFHLSTVDEPLPAALLASKALPPDLRKTMERQLASVVEELANKITLDQLAKLGTQVDALNKLKTDTLSLGLSAPYAEHTRRALEAATKRLAVSFARQFYAQTPSTTTTPTRQLLDRAYAGLGKDVVSEALREAAKPITGSAGLAFDNLFALSANVAWAEAQVTSLLADSLHTSKKQGREAAESLLDSILSRYERAGRPVPATITAHPVAVWVRAQKEAEKLAARAKVEATLAAHGLKHPDDYTYMKRGAWAIKYGVELHSAPDPTMSDSQLLKTLAESRWQHLIKNDMIPNPYDATLIWAKPVAVDTGRVVGGSRNGQLFAMARIVVHGTFKNELGVRKGFYLGSCYRVYFDDEAYVGPFFTRSGSNNKTQDGYLDELRSLIAIHQRFSKADVRPPLESIIQMTSPEMESLRRTAEAGGFLKSNVTLEQRLESLNAQAAIAANMAPGEEGMGTIGSCPGLIRTLDEEK